MVMSLLAHHEEASMFSHAVFPTLAALVLAQAPPASAFAPPKAIKPDPETFKAIGQRKDKLAGALAKMRQQGIRDPFLAQVEIYHKAADWIVRHGEFYQKESPEWTLAVLDRGLLRASQQLRGEAPWLDQAGVGVIRAYRSRLDGSVQPYLVTFPNDYGKDPRRKWRVDVVLHGRAPTMTEVAFIQRGDRPAPADQSWVQIDIYGRGNNAYRWAGEADVNEAVDNFVSVERMLGRAQLLDPARMVLRGYSMGGAGTWHLGLHRPDRWCVIGPGAGFTTTHGYVNGLPDKLPSPQEELLSIYDAVNYAENAFNVPVVAYNGDKDAQKQAAVEIETRLKPLGISITHLIGPGLGHAFPKEWQIKAEAEYAKHVARVRPEYPRRVRFVTYTLKYPACFWVELIRLDRHFHKASVDAEATEEGFTLKIENVRALSLALPAGATRQKVLVTLGDQKVDALPYQKANGELHVYLQLRDGRWSSVLPERLYLEQLRSPHKTTGLQGPIDDAFTAPFLCVRGTGKPRHEATQKYADAELERFEAEWSKYLRGELPVKDDVDVTPDDIASRHLILFGDPASNSLIEQALPGLPLRWTNESLILESKKYDAASHVPVLIYPSPLANHRYVVLNSGHTFKAADFQGTNALLYPRLGDRAVLKLQQDEVPLAAEVVRSELLDDSWQPMSAR